MKRLRQLKGASGVYEMHPGGLARGGMALVRIGRAVGGPASGRLVAIKQLDTKLASQAAFIAMFLDEGRLAMRIRHRNVVATLDVLENRGELFQILEYVRGESLAKVTRCAIEQGKRIPLPVVSAIVCDALRGLDCAHHTRRGDEALGVVHRDISPQNILVGADGVARILDFGVAKSAHRVHWTLDGTVKGKVGYVAPEQLSRRAVTARADLYSLGVVLWEMVTGRKLRLGSGPTEMLREALRPVPPASSFVPSLDADLDGVVARACALDPLDRYASAAQMESALAAALPPASPVEVAAFMKDVAGEALAARERLVHEAGLDVLEGNVVSTLPPPPPDSAARGRLLRASTKPFNTHSELDDAYLSLAGFTPQPPRLASLHPEPVDVRSMELGASPPLRLTAATAKRRGRSMRSNVFYRPAQPTAQPVPHPAARAPLSTRDELAAASAAPIDGARAVWPDVRPSPTPLPFSDAPHEAAVPSSFRRLMSAAACVLTLAAVAVLLLGFTTSHPAARPRAAYAWIGGYSMVIRGLPPEVAATDTRNGPVR